MAGTDVSTKMLCKNILIATDFSAISDLAMSYAYLIARRFHATIHLLHVIKPQSYEFLQPGMMPIAFEQIRQNAQEQLQSLVNRLGDVATQIWLREGFVGESVEAVASFNQVDLIVIGTRGLGNLEKLALGSAAEEIFRATQCPVLTVSPRVAAENLKVQLRRIVYPTDLLPESHLR